LRSIAFYGKGGIGKSTVLSNVVAALSKRGKKILQIGCDPKHDSTRLILGGFTQATVLEQLNTTGRVSLDSVMLTGCNGVKCIESGGPEPGVGCAGRGIIQMLNLLREQGLDTKQFDYVFFDVLGDVVCGGFAVPMREGYADEVYIVTSGEIAALYAANNIAKGIKRFSTHHGKLGGVIGNGRGTRNERETISAFARLIGTEMVTFIPKSELIVQAEFDSKTIVDYAPDSELAAIFQSIASHIESQKDPVVPKPLTDKELDKFLHDYCYNLTSTNQTRTVSNQSSNKAQPPLSNDAASALAQKLEFSNSNKACSSSINNRPPVQGCSLAGAFAAIRKIKDGMAIMHAPQGCAFVSFSGFLSRAVFSPSEARFPPNLLCTNMQETDVIFGGVKNLKDTVVDVHRRFPSYAIFIITSCSSGIIGDDVNQVVEELRADGIPLYFIPTDGVMDNGDFYTGMVNAYRVVAESLIDDTVCPQDDSVNIIGEQTLFPLGIHNNDVLQQIFEKLHISVNCRFLGDTTIGEIRQFKKAKVNIPFFHDPLVRDVTNFLETRFSMETLEVPLPVGFEQTAEFTRVVGRRFDKAAEAERIISESRTAYERRLSTLKAYFSGKKALIFSTPHNIDWLVSTMMDLDVDLLKIYSTSHFPPRESFSTKYAEKIQIENNYPINKLKQALLEERPDFVLTTVNSFNSVPYDVLPAAVLPVLPVYGFDGGLAYANRLYLKMKYPSIEGWRHDKKLVQGCA
jgi:nitrogenase iron protein NifH